jgi:beta-lactamase regulating signal transducer with metallopeptidase domain
MIVHEKAHKEEFHTFDVLLLEITTIFQWFNTFVWMFRRPLKSEHEFIADSRVLN